MGDQRAIFGAILRDRQHRFCEVETDGEPIQHLDPAGQRPVQRFALGVHRTGRFGEAVVAHATANAVLAAFALFGNQWQLW